MSVLRIVLLTAVFSSCACAQLSTDQKLQDFRTIVAAYSSYYGAYEWKRDVIGFDLMNAGPWLERVARSKDDLEFLEICMQYVASLADAHDGLWLTTNFAARLPFRVDIYDSKVLIDAITRTALPAAEFPFEIGDELVSIDGRPVEKLIEEFVKLVSDGNPRSARRRAANRLTQRNQSVVPRAHEVGDRAQIEVRRSEGRIETYSIPWTKSGQPFTGWGPRVSFKSAVPSRSAESEPAPSYMRLIESMRYFAVPGESAILGLDFVTPVYAMPDGFVQRLGKSPTDVFTSGTYQAGDYKIGYLRIPTWDITVPARVTAAVKQFEDEIRYFQSNTDGLVIDQTRNSGGNACSYQTGILQRLIPYTYRRLGLEYRATWTDVYYARVALDQAQRAGAEQWVQDVLQNYLEVVQAAASRPLGRTEPMPICGELSWDVEPARDASGQTIAYTKPIIVLIDEFDGSAADILPATLQDSGRGLLFGMRTEGAGATDYYGGYPLMGYTDGLSMSISHVLFTRRAPISTPDFPTTYYVENVGVRPDIVYDYTLLSKLAK